MDVKPILRLLLIITALSAPIGAAEPSHYRAGVKAYLEGNTTSAISHLEMAIRNGDSPDKAKLLLSKIQSRSEPPKAPVASKSEAPVAPPAVVPSIPKVPAKRVRPAKVFIPPVATPTPEDTPRPTPTPFVGPVKAKVSAPTPVPREKEIPAFENLDNRSLIVLVGGIGLFLLLVMVAGIYAQAQKTQRKLLEKIEALQKSAALDAERSRQRTEEERVRREAQERRLEEERKLKAEMAERRRAEEEKLKKELEAKRRAEMPAPVAPPPVVEKKGFVEHQKDRIMEILVDITPPERTVAWARIAAQVHELHRSSPEAAMTFLHQLAQDKNVWTRASIVSSLAAIASPEAVALLIELHKDQRPELKREVLRNIKLLVDTPPAELSKESRDKIIEALLEEKQSGGWIV